MEVLNLDKINKINDDIVFTFKNPYEKDWIDKKVQQNLETCYVHIVYAKNKKTKNEILAYEQYAECKYEQKEINDNWTYVLQKWYCAD